MKLAIFALLLGLSAVSALECETDGCKDTRASNCESGMDCSDFENCAPNPDSESGCVLEFVFDMMSSSTTSEADCDDDEDAHNWEIDYIGKSTQFRLYDPCDGDFVKIKMEELIELKPDGKKTGNKETSFASADWSWGIGGGPGEYLGYNAIINQYEATGLTKMDASLLFTTIFFREDAVVNGEDVSRNAFKFSMEVEGWEYDDEDNYLQMCIDVMTSKSGAFEEEAGADTTDYVFNDFSISNVAGADCDDGSTVAVTTTIGGNLKNHLTVCYNFESQCPGDGGEIRYDPVVTYVGGGGSGATSQSLFVAIALSLSVFSLFLS